MAIEDAAALGILFDRKRFNGSIEESLSVYNTVRLPRATRVQAAAARAASNINERIGTVPFLTTRYVQPAKRVDFTGFSDNKHTATYKVESEQAKLTIEEMNAYVYLISMS
jgi:salicylate hydroxylase